jgi:signal transduction histidine kinase
MGIYFAGFVVIGAALTARSGWFGLFTWMGLGTAQRFLAGRWRYPGVVAAAAVVSAAQHPFQRPIASWVLACLILTGVNTAIACMVGGFLRRTEGQNTARKGMIAELAEANARLEEMVAENAGLHAQLLTHAREAGVLEERQRMAREIHDTLAQGLTGIVTQLEAAELAHSGAEWGRRLDNAKRLARDSLAEARRSVRALRPEPLDNATLPDAIAEVAER